MGGVRRLIAILHSKTQGSKNMKVSNMF